MQTLSQLLKGLLTVPHAIRAYFEERHAKYEFKFDENGIELFRNRLLIKQLDWSNICRCALWQTDALTTECDNLALYDQAAEVFAINDFSPRFLEFSDFLEAQFPGFGKISDEYFGKAVGKFGEVPPLLLELKLGKAPKIVANP
jgi:hypothetical protein